MKKAILFICSLCCVLGGTFTSYASEMQTNELLIVEEEQTAEAIAPTIFVADTSQIYTYTMMQNDSFKERLREAREQATSETITYLQGNLSTCAESLMEIVKDKSISPQIRINAINAVFNNLKILNGDSDKLIQGVAVQIYDSI